MTDLYFDTTDYDMGLDGQDIAFTTAENIVEQRLKSRLQLFKGEWFLNTLAGVPYTQTIFEAGTDLNDIYELFRKEITDTEGVEILDSLEITQNTDDRNITITFSVNNGQTQSTVEI